MPKPFKIDRPHHQLVTLPESLWAKLSLHLHSPLEGRVPMGAWQEFWVARAEEYLRQLEKP